MTDSAHYAIRGGVEGRERLRVLGRVMHTVSCSLFERVGLKRGMRCVDVGCGGGDATLEIARRVGPHGSVLGLDIDTTKLDLAREEAAERGVTNVRFERLDIRDGSVDSLFDVVYSRFLLTHLSEPGAVVSAFSRHVRPGGTVVVEDIDFSGYFTYPESPSFRRYHDWYCAAVRKRGGDPNVGPRLPGLLADAGLVDVGVEVVQPLATSGEPKLINALTMENIRGAVAEDGLGTHEEIDAVVHDLYAFAHDPTTLAGMPRVIQSWGRRPAS